MNSHTRLKLKQITAVFVAITLLQTQIVFAGVSVSPIPPNGFQNLKVLSKDFANAILKSSLIAFRAFPYTNFLDPRGQTDIPPAGRVTPQELTDQEEKELSILRQLEELEIFKQESFANRPQLPNKKANILDEMTTFKLNVNVSREMKLVQEDRLRAASDIEEEIQELRQNIQGAGGSMRRQADGSRWFFLHGLTVSIRGQRFVDGNGNVTVVDTRRIRYDKDTRLRIGHTQVSTDALGNVTTTVRSGVTYTADSSEHGKQIVTAYKDTIMDPNGNIRIVKRENIQYLDAPDMAARHQGQFVISYDETEIDQFGNKTTRAWTGGEYLKRGDSFYLSKYFQNETDSDGNVNHIAWTATTYAFNHNYQH